MNKQASQRHPTKLYTRSSQLPPCPALPRHQRRALHRLAVAWYLQNGRSFPWRSTSDPYRIFIAEVLLRQTQASRIVEPYLQLVSTYPDVRSLGAADPTQLRRIFAPLGLTKRADRMVCAAQTIVRDHGGRFPSSLQDLRRLPGLGPYSASAILCLAFDHRLPMIDQPTGRLLRRVLGLPPGAAPPTDTQLIRLATDLLPKATCVEFNLALIDIAAAYCRPTAPACGQCPLANCCSAAKSEG